MTGIDWFEETLARRKRDVPFNLEAAIKQRGADLKKAFIPMTSKVVVDGNLITGQNPFSSKEMAKVVTRELEKRLNNIHCEPHHGLCYFTFPALPRETAV